MIGNVQHEKEITAKTPGHRKKTEGYRVFTPLLVDNLNHKPGSVRSVMYSWQRAAR